MNLLKMKYRDFIFPNNPSELTVKQMKNIKETYVPFGMASAKNMGQSRRKVEGKGYFTGKDARKTFEKLQIEFQKGDGILQLPESEPFMAEMEKLTLVNSDGENLIEYSFTFIETRAKSSPSEPDTYVAKEGESLWDIAFRYDKEVNNIVELNPQVRRINCLEEGETVVLR